MESRVIEENNTRDDISLLAIVQQKIERKLFYFFRVDIVDSYTVTIPTMLLYKNSFRRQYKTVVFYD